MLGYTFPSTLSYTSLIVLLFSFSFSVTAQNNNNHTFQPSVKTGSLSTYVDGKGMYILGGQSGAGQSYSTQAFMIDLSVPWNVSNPAYKSLVNGPVGFYQMASALSPDGNTWFAQNGNTAFFYDFTSSKWSTIPSTTTSGQSLNSNLGLGAATDPNTGIIYVPNGLVSSSGQYMLRVHPDETIDSVAMSSQISKTPSPTVAWSSNRQSMIYFDESTSNMFAYNPKSASSSSGGWSQLTINGAIPSPRTSACFVEAYGGTKMILFGGYDSNLQTSLNTIYILEMSNLTWTSGVSFIPTTPPPTNNGNSTNSTTPTTSGRMGAACGVSGDYFIAWGGQSEPFGDVDMTAWNATLLYNIKNNTWQTSYVVPIATDSSSSHRVRAISIAGAVIGSIVLLAIIGVLVYREQQRRKRRKAKARAEAEAIAGVTAGGYEDNLYLEAAPISSYYDKESLPSIVVGRFTDRYSTNPPTYSMTTSPPGYRLTCVNN
ncbi:hypothetical protein BGZ49_002425 [Haplosporangium sp. Z 27]|nr:hypothetical protein BGZ49_002425 [Haplosporangium sp. Z 27]